MAVLINNYFLLPALAVAFALIPFLYAGRTITLYNTRLEEEMETALSIVTTSYIRNNDLITAVSENLDYIKPPMDELFRSFVGETTTINPDIKRAIYHLREHSDNEVFREWCDMLMSCQDDQTMKDNLLPIVAKFTDVRIVNNELKTMIYQSKKEYYLLLVLLVANFPLLYAINKDWFNVLIYTTAGKITLAVCAVVVLITGILMTKYTKPITYKR